MINWSQKLFTFYSRLDRSVIIMYHHKLYLLLVILVVSCHAAFEETSRFMTDNGFGHVSHNLWRRRSKYARFLPSQTSPSALQRSPPPQRRRLASPPGEDDGHDNVCNTCLLRVLTILTFFDIIFVAS